MEKVTVNLIRLVSVASTLYNTQTGRYIQWGLDEEAETVYFTEDGVFLFALPYDHKVIHANKKDWILEDEKTNTWIVRPFFELDVTSILLSQNSDDEQISVGEIFNDLDNHISSVLMPTDG